MNRAERRRLEAAQRKQAEKESTIIKKINGVALPLAPVKQISSNASVEEIAEATGTKVMDLKRWMDEREKEIRNACIAEAQQKLDRAEEYITLMNVVASLKALDGFRYGKSAAHYMLDHFNESAEYVKKDTVKETYAFFRDKWDLDVEFDEYDLNKELGYDTIDWTYAYLNMHVPERVYQTVYNDASNIEKVITQISVIWALCEGFGYHKHPESKGNMLNKFMKICKEKYDILEARKDPATFGQKLLKDKYEITINWSEQIQKTMDRFKL